MNGAFVPPVLENGRAWGIAANLYALRSARNWGIGDFTDLRTLVAWAREIGADMVGLNPLHALHYTEPEAASPYSPTSRYYLNPLYIDVDAVPELDADIPAAEALRTRVRSEPFVSTLATLRASSHVAYARVARAKWSALTAAYEIMRDARGERFAAFRSFCERGGERLERFAVHEALAERFVGAENVGRDWQAWPSAFQSSGAPEVKAWAAHARRRVDYFKYLQWLAHEQLELAAREAAELSIGLYLDIAVGVDAGSADVWSDPSAFILDESVGAPPDALGPLGQDWGLPAPDPSSLVRDGEQGFAELLATAMVHCGALRIDHVMALLRLFRIPRGKTPAEGTYVTYPFDELLAIARTESRRAQCLIVGEDLGNVPNGFRERMALERIFSYRVLLFERAPGGGAFIAPGDYPELALATATTHDVPTVIGWAIGRDIDVRQGLAMLSPEVAAAAHIVRRAEVAKLLEALGASGVIDPEDATRVASALDRRSHDVLSYLPLVHAAYRFIAKTRARLVLVALDDAAGELEQINLPGTSSEYPNWRRKSGLDLETIVRDTRIASLASDVRRLVKGEAPV